MSVFSSLFVPETSTVPVSSAPNGGNLRGGYRRALPLFTLPKRGINSLPLELLSKILLLVPDRFEDVPNTWRFSCVLLGFVCMAWMEIVEHDPHFFCCLYIDMNISLSVLARCRERSGTTPLHITIIFPVPDSDTVSSTRAWRSFNFRQQRMLDVSLSSSGAGHRQPQFAQACFHALLNDVGRSSGTVVGLYCRLHGSLGISVLRAIRRCPPRLSQMHIRYQGILWSNLLFMATLTRLTIDSFFDINPTLDFIYGMLDAAPRLQFLRLRLLTVADLEDSDKVAPSLAYLTEIEVAADSESGSCLLSLLGLPSLRVLRFKVEDEEDCAIDGLLGHCWKIGPQISRLGLQVSLPSVQLFLDCFAVFPNVETFDARGANIGFGVYLHTVVSHWAGRWPCLREVFLDDYLEDDILLALLRGLAGTAGSLGRITVISPREKDVYGNFGVPLANFITSAGLLDDVPYCT
ncbi:hypothetical protein R3P38DRAFT_2812263 [Favolaschia claudopus]|uniref:F-box domain-containing protein n=1 Tax=Favolaschia claudopus TaxID=2862362 RepID=A0AAV9Z752_9AGAR